ncbi:MAG: Plug domain-containing protein [Gemmatimonas sp.]
MLLLGVALPQRLASAQTRVDTTRADTTKRVVPPVDSVTQPPVTVLDTAAQRRAQHRIDSIAAFRKADTIKAPLAHFEKPLSFEVDERLRFDRTQILTSEATNLSELLALVPGVTHYASGWLQSAHLASYGGDFARVRVFMDGVEMDANDPRSNGVLDLIDVRLWLLDEIVIERTAGEVRVWCRTASNNRTTPFTRTDIYTGDLNTNGFRALFARRFTNGMLLQVNGEQFATQQGRQSQFGTTTAAGRGDGGNQILNARVGFGRKRVSADVYGLITTRDRDAQAGIDSTPPIAAYKGTRREVTARVAVGDSMNGLWSQLVFNSLRTRLEGIRAAADTDTTNHSDTTRSRDMKMFAVGYRTQTMQLSFTERLRTFNGKAWSSPAVRAGYTTKWLSAGAFLERQAIDSSSHLDATVRVAPVKWGAASFSQSVRRFDVGTADGETSVDGSAVDGTVADSLRRPIENQSRVEGGVLWHGHWFTGGFIRQSNFLQKPPTLITGTGTGRFIAPASKGYTFGVRGKVYREIGLDVQGIRWNNAALYRPQFSTRTDVSLVTNWLSRFPKGEFGINLHVIHELRDPITFSYTNEKLHKQITVTSLRSQIFTTLFEIRIQHMTVFYHFHNMSGQAYELLPGIVMPRQVQMYGIRWDFWN